MGREFNLWFWFWDLGYSTHPDTLGQSSGAAQKADALSSSCLCFGLDPASLPPSLAALPELSSPAPPARLLFQYPDRLWDFFLKAIKHKWILNYQLGLFPLL